MIACSLHLNQNLFDEPGSVFQVLILHRIYHMKNSVLRTLLLRFGCVFVTTLVLAGALPAKDVAPYDYETLFDPSRLVRVDIQIEQADWDQMRMQHRSLLRTLRTDVPPSKQEKQFDYFEGNLTIDGTDVGRVAIRKKGFVGSMDRLRPSLKIQIDEFDKKKSFAGIDTITLNNNKQDPSCLNQLLGFQLFRQAGLPAARCNLAVVTVNGESLGVYTNVESPDKRFARRNFGNDDGALYEGTIADFNEDSLIRFERKFGKKKTDKQLAKVVEALNADDASLIDQLGKVIDLDQFYRYWAMESLLGHWDGYVSNRNNYFVYFNPATERIVFIPWGLDQLGEDSNMFWPRDFEPPKSVKADGALPRRLYQIEEARDAYFATMRHLLGTVWNEDALITHIGRLEEMIKPHRVDRGNDQRQTGVDIKEFITTRRAQIEGEMEGPHPEWTLAFRDTPPPLEKRGECEVRFNLKLASTESAPDTFEATAGDAEVTLVFDGRELPFNSSLLALKQNKGQQGEDSWTLQITRADAVDGTPSTIEITFPNRPHDRHAPYRIDAFASQARGRLLKGSGDVGQDGSLGLLAGSLELTAFGNKPGDSISGTLVGEFFLFIPRNPGGGGE